MYKATNKTAVINVESGVFIPADPANVDYQQFLAWVKAGNTPEPADTVLPPTPLQEIANIEAANPITPRMLRELTLSVAEIASAVTGKAPEENKAVRDILKLEAEIAALRQQAREQGLIP